MSPTLSFAAQLSASLAELDIEPIGKVGLDQQTPGISIDAIQETVAQAFDQPLDFPPLEETLMPGDRVAIVPSVDLPDRADLVGAVCNYLIHAGVDPKNICVLLPEPIRRADTEPTELRFQQDLLETIDSDIEILLHKPESETDLAFLSTNEEGSPVMLNRQLVDADVVIPINHFRIGADEYYGMFDPLWPRMSNRETLARFSNLKSSDRRGRRHKRLTQEADWVGWVLGSIFTVQVITGPEAKTAHFLAGQLDPVRAQANELYRSIWQCEIDRPADLAILVLGGSSQEQSWKQLVDAIGSVEQILKPNAQIAVCSQLVDPPGQAIRLLAEAASREEATAAIHRAETIPDSSEALRLAEMLENHSLFLLSGLDPYLVEEYGIVPVDSLEQLVRLAESSHSVLLVNGAPLATIDLKTG
jgi:lactate racemase-like protein